MLSYPDALQLVLDTVKPLPPVTLPLGQCVGRVLAEPALARWDQPPADNSAMDGYALRIFDQPDNLRLKLVGEAFAGHPFSGRIAPGEASKITTGAPLPAGCDSIVPIEDTSRDGNDVVLNTIPVPGQHIRRKGEEFTAGETLLEPGCLLRAGAIGLLASAGLEQLRVYPRPRVAILSTGDELVELGETPGPGQIVNSNLHLLIARLRELDCEPLPIGIGRDTPEALAEALQSARQSDLLVSTGGVSVGERDHVQASLQTLGFTRKFWKVAIKPGKPVLFGTLGTTPVFGLPGNPAATAATCELFVRPALRILAGHRQVRPTEVRVTLADTVDPDRHRLTFIWGRLELRTGELFFHPSAHQGSGQNRSHQGAQALLPVAPELGRLPRGGTANAIMLYGPT